MAFIPCSDITSSSTGSDIHLAMEWLDSRVSLGKHWPSIKIDLIYLKEEEEEEDEEEEEEVLMTTVLGYVLGRQGSWGGGSWANTESSPEEQVLSVSRPVGEYCSKVTDRSR